MEISRRASDGQLRACVQSIPCLHTFRRDRQRRLLAVKDKVRGHNSPRQRPRGSGHCLEQPAPTSGQIRVLSHQIDPLRPGKQLSKHKQRPPVTYHWPGSSRGAQEFQFGLDLILDGLEEAIKAPR